MTPNDEIRLLQVYVISKVMKKCLGLVLLTLKGLWQKHLAKCLVVIDWCFSISQSWPSILLKAFCYKPFSVSNSDPRFHKVQRNKFMNTSWYGNNWVHYSLMVVSFCLHITLLHYHHYADMCIKDEARSYNYLPCNKLWLCVFSLPMSLMVIVKIHILYLIIFKSEVWPICDFF